RLGQAHHLAVRRQHVERVHEVAEAVDVRVQVRRRLDHETERATMLNVVVHRRDAQLTVVLADRRPEGEPGLMADHVVHATSVAVWKSSFRSAVSAPAIAPTKRARKTCRPPFPSAQAPSAATSRWG